MIFIGKMQSTLFGVCLTAMTFAQTNISDLKRINDLWTKKGDTNPFTGDVIEHFENGKVKGRGQFKKGLVNGLRIMNYESGNKHMEKNYSEGQSNGKNTEYYENGAIKQEGDFKNGKEIGTWKIYYESGKLNALLNFSDGAQQGDYYEYSKERKLTTQYYFVNGTATYSPEFIALTKQAFELSRKFKNEEAIKTLRQSP